MKLEDKLKSLLAIFAAWQISFLLLGVTPYNFMCLDMYKNIEWWRYLLSAVAGIVSLLILFSNTIEEKRKEWIMKRRHLTGNIISRRIGSVKILDNEGKRARYCEQIYIAKVNSNQPLSAILTADEKIKDSSFDIDSAQLNNCTIKPSNNNKTVRIIYIDDLVSATFDDEKRKKKNKNLNKIFDFDKFYVYSIESVNCFTNKEKDFWMINFETYTQDYQLTIEFPHDKKIKSAILYKREKDDEKIVEFASPIIHNNINNECNTITIQIIDYEVKNCFVLRWEYS